MKLSLVKHIAAAKVGASTALSSSLPVYIQLASNLQPALPEKEGAVDHGAPLQILCLGCLVSCSALKFLSVNEKQVPGERWSSAEVHILSLISAQHSHRLQWEFRNWINVRIWAFTFRCESVLIVVGKLVMN